MFFDSGGVSPGTSDVEDSGGGFTIAFFFDGGSGRGLVDAYAPDQTITTESDLDGAFDLTPLGSTFLVEIKIGVGAGPRIGISHHGLLAFANSLTQ